MHSKRQSAAVVVPARRHSSYDSSGVTRYVSATHAYTWPEYMPRTKQRTLNRTSTVRFPCTSTSLRRPFSVSVAVQQQQQRPQHDNDGLTAAGAPVTSSVTCRPAVSAAAASWLSQQQLLPLSQCGMSLSHVSRMPFMSHACYCCH